MDMQFFDENALKALIRSVIISQGQANFGRAFGILDKCCQL